MLHVKMYFQYIHLKTGIFIKKKKYPPFIMYYKLIMFVKNKASYKTLTTTET